MFGYVRPVRPELKCKDFDLYRATYCGLCRCLRRRFGLIAPMLLNFDFTFLTLLLWQPEEKFSPCRGRCHANLLVKKPMCPDSPALKLAADESVILAWWQLRDAAEDKDKLGGLPARALGLLLTPAYRKAARLRPEFDRTVKGCLEEAELPYTVDPRIVRGLDYYTRTVFEFVSDALGAQAVVCGGGRYDGLCQELGGPSIPSLGFGMGLERLLLVMEAKGCAFPAPPRCELYLAPMGEAAVRRCFAIASRLREGGVAVEFDVAGRGLKAQMKYADKLGARYVIVVGDSELETGMAKLKDMESGEASDIALDDSLYTTLYNKSLDRQLAGMADLLGGELLKIGRAHV